MLIEPRSGKSHNSRRMNGAPDHPKIIGQRLVALRKAFNMRQVDFAKWCGISTPALANYEVGDRRPEINQMAKIRDKTGITYEFLLHGDIRGVPVEVADNVRAALREIDDDQSKGA